MDHNKLFIFGFLSAKNMKKIYFMLIVFLLLHGFAATAQDKNKITTATDFCTFAKKMLDYSDKDLKDIINAKLDSDITADSDHVFAYSSNYLWTGAVSTFIQSSNYDGWSYEVLLKETENLQEFENCYNSYSKLLKGCKSLKLTSEDTSGTYVVKGYPNLIYIRKTDNPDDMTRAYPNSFRLNGFKFDTGTYEVHLYIYPERR
jgi:hypothetical protein